MKLLVLTQKLDRKDDVLGFMHGWIGEFAKQSDGVVAIGLSVGEHDLPKNVRVLSLGKETRQSRLQYLFRFFSYIWRYRSEYDAVFVHMNQVYVILGAPLWRLLGKKVSLWYAHGHVPFSLRVATWLTHLVFTSTESGFRIASCKKRVIGQAIDVEKFRPEPKGNSVSQSIFQIVTVGRISPSKDYKTLIEAADILQKKGRVFRVTLVGKPAIGADEQYLAELMHEIEVRKLGAQFVFAGGVANDQIVPFLREADLFVNMGLTGSLDKAVPEAMATGLPILTCNEALLEVLGEYQSVCMFPKHYAGALSVKIEEMMAMSPSDRSRLGVALREIVVRDHSLPRFVTRLLLELNK